MPDETGGIGYSWFLVELTSENVIDPVWGGVGQSWFQVELTSDHVPGGPEPEAPVAGGSEGQQIYGAGPWIIPWEQSFEGRVRLRKKIEVVLASGVLARPPAEVFTHRIGGKVNLAKQFSVSFSATRTPARHWNRLIAEDEEILLSL